MDLKSIYRKYNHIKTQINDLQDKIDRLNVITPIKDYSLIEKVQSSHKRKYDDKVVDCIHKIQRYEMEIEDLEFELFSMDLAINTLDPKEKVVFECVGEGDSIAETMRMTLLSRRTVENMIQDIEQRLTFYLEDSI
jgi:prefoldin subunit 5